jgi:hypothetical protein
VNVVAEQGVGDMGVEQQHQHLDEFVEHDPVGDAGTVTVQRLLWMVGRTGVE